MALTATSINTLEYDQRRCIGCGMCVDVCPHGVFAMEGREARVARRPACIECGACQMNCPAEAISVDSGVGCATAFIYGILSGTEPNCGSDCCGGDNSSCG